MLEPPPLPPPLPSVEGHSTEPVESVIVTLSVLRPFTDEAVSCAMPRTAPGPSVSDGLPSMIAAVAGEASSANRSSCGITIWTLRVRDAVDAAKRLGDLTLQRALVGDLLLELRGAELGLSSSS